MKLTFALILALSMLACAPKSPATPESDRLDVLAEPGSPGCFFVYSDSIKLQCT